MRYMLLTGSAQLLRSKYRTFLSYLISPGKLRPSKVIFKTAETKTTTKNPNKSTTKKPTKINQLFLLLLMHKQFRAGVKRLS